jgi:TRAP-type transport system small permease protein
LNRLRKPIFRRVAEWIVAASGMVAGLCLAAIVAAMATQVVFRYLIGAPLSWPEELSRLLFIWMTYGGCLMLPAMRAHISIDFVHGLMPTRLQKLSDTASDMLGLVFFAFLAVSAYQLGVATGRLRLPGLQYPATVIYWFLASAAALHALLFLEALWSRVTGRSWDDARIEGADERT